MTSFSSSDSIAIIFLFTGVSIEVPEELGWRGGVVDPFTCKSVSSFVTTSVISSLSTSDSSCFSAHGNKVDWQFRAECGASKEAMPNVRRNDSRAKANRISKEPVRKDH